MQLLFNKNFYNIDLEFLNKVITLIATHIYRTQIEEEMTNYINLIDKYILISKTDLNGVIIEVSEFFCKLFEYSKEELIGKTHKILHHEDTPDELIKDLWKTIKAGKIWEGEIKNKTKYGKDIWVYTIITPDKDLNGNIIGFTAIRYDITDKKMIEKLSITDGLTSLFNRRHFDQVFPQQILIAKRNSQKIAFGIIDIDHFKQFNDIYGHQQGDQILKKVAECLKNILKRADDFVFRLGGEEFGILYKVKNEKEAITIAENIRTSIENLKILHKGNKSVSKYLTISIGITIIEPDIEENFESFYKKADKALYKAKNGGRNRVVII